jgi:hypothetical protein
MLNTGVTFKCLISGQTVTFIHQVDIDSMKGHPDYERVEEVAPVVVEEAPKKAAGRPKKVENTPEVE